MTPVLTAIALIAYWVIFASDLVFIWRLSLSNWRAHAWGRNVMAFTVMLEVQIGLILARTVFGDYPLRQYLIVGCSVVFAIVVVNRLYIWIKGERAQAREREGGDSEGFQVSAGGLDDSDPDVPRNSGHDRPGG